MTETSRRWNSLMEFIKGKTRSVMVFEPSQEDLDSFCEELRLAGHVVHGYSAIAQIEAGELPYIVDYVFFNTSFGQVEKPTESWSVSQFLNAFSIRVDENHILTYYSESIKPEISTAMKTVREALKYDPLQLDLILNLSSSPTVREQLRTDRQIIWLELLCYGSLLVFLVWAIAAGLPLLIFAAGLIGSTLVAFSIVEIIMGICRVILHRDYNPTARAPVPASDLSRSYAGGVTRGGVYKGLTDDD